MVLAVLRHQLQSSRQAGASFETAWPAAQLRALSVAHAVDRPDWRAALNSTRGAWQAAFEDQPVSAFAAAAAMVAA